MRLPLQSTSLVAPRGALMLMLTALTLPIACSEPATPDGEPASAAPVPAAQDAVVIEQAVTDASGPNYMAVGGAFVDLLGEDGEPDELAGRLVNAGTGVSAGSSNANGWLLAGPTGQLTFLDDDGRPLKGGTDTVIEGESVRFATLGERYIETIMETRQAWLIGGTEGRVQLVNDEGAPEFAITGQVMINAAPATLTSGAYSKSAEQWLVGTDEGALVSLDVALTQVSSDFNVLGADVPIAAIVGNPSAAAAADKRWLVAGGDKLSYYQTPNPITFSGVTFTTLTEADGKVAAGTSDGRVAIWDFEGVSAPGNFVQVFDQVAVTAIVSNGTQWLVLGEEGMARLLDASGAAVGEAVKRGDGSPLVSATWAKERWLVVTQSSLVLDLSATLELRTTYVQPLDGAAIYESAPAQDRVVVVGEQGKYAVLSPRGELMGSAAQLAGNPTLRAAAWSGSTFLIGGDQGTAQLLDESGAASGEPMTLLGAKTIEAIAWSGNVWLVGGEGGTIQRVRPTGESVGETSTIQGIDFINDIRWNAEEWMLVGQGNGRGVAQRIKSDATAIGSLITLSGFETLNAVEWSGREWIVGGNAGLVQAISSDGTPRTQPGPQPRDVLTGQDIHTIDFHKGAYMVAGANGLTRLVNSELQGSQPPVAVAGFETIRDIRWTRARGFGRGECITNELCYVGKCLEGGLNNGFCCDRACDRACESCLASESGAMDGICSPLPADSEPVNAGCEAEDASTCGNTGLCDGTGECALHGPEVACAAASCAAGEVTPESLCDGAGACVTPEVLSCDPYLTCEGDSCGTSCTGDEECVSGRVCVDGMCVEMMEVEEMPMMEPEPETEGCCAIVAPHEKPSPWGLLALVGLLFWRRRRNA